MEQQAKSVAMPPGFLPLLPMAILGLIDACLYTSQSRLHLGPVKFEKIAEIPIILLGLSQVCLFKKWIYARRRHRK